jgi:selenophosphate synthetase-related protein
VLAIPEADRAIAVSIDGNGRRVACDPWAGTVEAVLECAQNLACVGAEPLGLTNCLNFGNPEKPLPAWQLDRSVQGLADACEALAVPVVGGNVSLYNEGPEGPIYPTPVVGMVGELPDPSLAVPSAFAREGDAIALVGPFEPSPAGSELAKLRGELDAGLPRPDIAAVAAACAAVREAVRAGKLASAHDVSDGGLACALAEAAIGSGLGCEVDLQHLRERGCSPEEALFGEGPGGFLVSGERESWRASPATASPSSISARSAARRSRSPPEIAASPSPSQMPVEPGARSRIASRAPPFRTGPIRAFSPCTPCAPSPAGVRDGGKRVTPRAATTALICLGATVLAVAALGGCGEDSEGSGPRELTWFVAIQPGGTIEEVSKRCSEESGGQLPRARRNSCPPKRASSANSWSAASAPTTPRSTSSVWT